MAEATYSIDGDHTVCTLIDDFDRRFIFSVPTDNYDTVKAAEYAALQLARAASETYKE